MYWGGGGVSILWACPFIIDTGYSSSSFYFWVHDLGRLKNIYIYNHWISKQKPFTKVSQRVDQSQPADYQLKKKTKNG